MFDNLSWFFCFILMFRYISSSGNSEFDNTVLFARNFDYRSGSPTGSESSGISSVGSTIADLMVLVASAFFFSEIQSALKDMIKVSS